MDISYNTLYIIILLLGAVVLLAKAIFKFPKGSLPDKLSLGLLSLLSLYSIYAYVQFGSFHDYGTFGRHTYHYHEMYHYAFGAKYYRELGYFELYDCTYVAFRELERVGVNIPHVPDIRSLEDPDTANSAEDVYFLKKESCPARFSPERWAEFKTDLAKFMTIGSDEATWRSIFYDAGFNPPPSWNLLLGWIANLVPFNMTTWEIFPFIDLICLFIINSLLLFWAFGPYGSFAYIIALSTNYLGSFAWTGGSFCRHIWLSLLIAGISCLKKERYGLSGIFFGICSIFRIFPAVFLFGTIWSLWSLSIGSKDIRRQLIRFLFAAFCSACILFMLSLLVYGLDSWGDFIAKISKHSGTFFVMHIGFEKYAVFPLMQGGQNFWFAPGLERFVRWQSQMRAIYDAHFITNTCIQAFAVISALLVSWKRLPWIASLIIGATLLFFFSMPANYYYIYFSILPVIFLSESSTWLSIFKLFLTFALLALVRVMPLLSPDDLIYNGYINTLIFSYFWILFISYWYEMREGQVS